MLFDRFVGRSAIGAVSLPLQFLDAGLAVKALPPNVVGTVDAC